MKASVVVARASHALRLAPRLRPSDLAELWAEAGLNADAAPGVLLNCIHYSNKAWAVVSNDEPHVLFGVAPNYIGGDAISGQAWLVASPDINKHSSFILRNSRKYIDEMHKIYPRLFNWVDDRNVTTGHWLRWCGFRETAHDATHGFGRLPFTLFEKT